MPLKAQHGPDGWREQVGKRGHQIGGLKLTPEGQEVPGGLELGEGINSLNRSNHHHPPFRLRINQQRVGQLLGCFGMV
jgi:hypothetical protein